MFIEKQYWVGDIYVDLSRNQLIHQNQSQILPPKALQVLTCLARQHRGVVSYEHILNEVWPNSVISPNTLQSSIAHLRKALGVYDLADIIKTHARQGYSLECEVRCSVNDFSKSDLSDVELSAKNKTEPRSINPKDGQQAVSPNDIHANIGSITGSAATQSQPDTQNKKVPKSYWVSAIAVLVLVVVAMLQFPNHSSKLQFGELRYLTATDDNEFGASYSPNGKYILFNRYYEQFSSNTIWAINTETHEEIQLIDKIGSYQGHALSPDGNNLIFIAQDDVLTTHGDRAKSDSQDTCYRLMKLDFNKALSAVQRPSELLGCQKSAINTPIWVDDHSIVMRQQSDQGWRLLRFSTNNNSSTVLYEITDGHVSSVAWSPEQEVFAVSALKNDGLQYIEMLFADGKVKSSYPIQLPETSPKYLKIAPQFTPSTGQLIFSFGSELFTLSEQGEVSKVNLPFETNVDTARFHPDGDRLLLVKGRFDSDVARLPIPVTESGPTTGEIPDLNATIFARSIETEHVAKFNPAGNAIAFASARTGTEQVWIRDATGTKKISALPSGTFIQNILWSSDGKSLLVYANWQMHLLSFDSDLTTLEFPHLIASLFDWDSKHQLVLANILVDGTRKFVNIDLNSLEYKVVNTKKIAWAVKSQQGLLIYMDEQHRIWQPGALEDKIIEPLLSRGLSKRFLIRNNALYGINKNQQLWLFDLQLGEFRVMGRVSPDIDYLTDISDQELLVTMAGKAKKEVIELLLSD